MKTKLGNDIEMLLMSKPAVFNGEDVTQIYLRSAKEGFGGGVLFDESTGLANREQMGFFIDQQLQKLGDDSESPGVLVYLFLRNYRDVWGSDGLEEAEKLIQATVVYLRKNLSSRTEIARYTDDGILFYCNDIGLDKIEDTLISLVEGLDKVTPEGMKRMIEPSAFLSYTPLDKSMSLDLIVSSIFKTTYSNAMADNDERVAIPSSISVSQKDNKRIEIIHDVLRQQRINMLFQPITSFEVDKKQRYRERVILLDTENQPLENSIMMGVAERYDLTQQLDMWKMTTIFQKLLAMDADKRKDVEVFVIISSSSLISKDFSKWLIEQIKHTGLGGGNFVFELMVDTVQSSYSAAIRFSDMIRDIGARIAVSKITALTEESTRVINDIKPNFIKIDLREIDTLDDYEEAEVMTAIKDKADEIGAVIIAEYIDSPAQLSRIWPYDVKLVQGDGMTLPLKEMDFSFKDFVL